MFLLSKNASHFFKINEINLSIAYKARKNRKFEITTKKFNRERIDLTIKLYFQSKISKIRDSKKNFFTSSRVFLKLSM